MITIQLRARRASTWIWKREHQLRPDSWQGRRRLTVAVLNWSNAPNATVCLAGLRAEGKLDGVESVQVCSVEDPAIRQELPLVGDQLEIPLSGWIPSAPIGRSSDNPLPETLPRFGVFLVEWQSPGWTSEERSPREMEDPGAGLPRKSA